MAPDSVAVNTPDKVPPIIISGIIKAGIASKKESNNSLPLNLSFSLPSNFLGFHFAWTYAYAICEKLTRSPGVIPAIKSFPQEIPVMEE